MTSVVAADNRVGADVLTAAFQNPGRKYPGRDDVRFDDALLLPGVTPSFQIPLDSAVFTIGSCFARNVEEELLARGLTVPTMGFSAAQDNVPGRSNRVLNQYNPGTMLQCIKGVAQGGLYETPDGEVVDCLLSTGRSAVTRERALERRSEVAQLYRDGLAASDTVVITLGLVETWIDLEAGLYLNDTPPPQLVRDTPERFAFRRLSVTDCVALLSEIVELLTKDRDRHILLTVSPVPLRATFTTDDAVTANGYSKAVLRVAAEDVSSRFAGVDYFPSFEVVTTAGFRSMARDNVHVRPATVSRIVDHMLDRYLQKARI